MKTLVFVIVIAGALIAIASGIWVATALGNAISRNKERDVPENSASDLTEE
ncbi:MAG: hypothetical protein JXA96_05015 [Sedimentisphaerales bacterium]|nr:hypothetical protein [Sedimentisphaerales bacterium]